MSRIYEALRQAGTAIGRPDPLDEAACASELIAPFLDETTNLEAARSFTLAPRIESRLVAALEPQSLGAEKLRILAAKLKFAQHRRAFNRVLITSAARGDGKSLVSSNLAITLAKQGNKTLLIDGDFHQGRLGAMLGARECEGLGEWWRDQGNVTKYLQRSEGMPLWFLPPGKLDEQPQTLLQSPQAAELMSELSSMFSWVVIDSPPMLPLADASVWVTLAEAVLFVVRQAVTPTRLLTASLESLDKSKLFGLIMNHADAREEKYYREYYRARSMTSAASSGI